MSFLKLAYILVFMYSFVLLAIRMKVFNKSTDQNFIVTLCCNVVGCFGYFHLVFAKNIPEAYLATKLTYLGGSFLVYFLFLIIVDACKVKLSNPVRVILFCITSTGFIMSMTIGESSLYYKSARIVYEIDYSYLIKDYGPLHSVYLIIMFGYMLASLVIAIRALTTPTLVSKRMAFSLAMVEVSGLSVYFVERIVKNHIDFTPFSNAVMLTIATFVFAKLYDYDANRVAQETREIYNDSAVVLFNADKKYVGCNTVALSLFDEITNYKVEELIDDKFENKQMFEGIINEFDQNEKAESSVVYRKNGEIYKIRIRLLDSAKVFKGRVYVLEFINDTQAQNYISKIQEMNFELENKAEEAKAASEAKSSFLANMSHEIRTPINAVLGLNSIILRDTKEERTREFSKDINNAGRSLLALINDILDFSKIEAGKMDIVPVNYQLSSLLNDCQSMLYSRINEKGLNFKLNCQESIPAELFGDETRIRQILINIMTNAVKYTESGTITMDVSHERLSDDKISLKLSVTDTGMGISEEDQKHLFESFKRVDEKKNRNIEGTGLGLSLVQNLTNLMGGEVTVKSKLGEGSTFSVVIPQTIVNDTPIGKFKRDIEKDAAPVKMDDLSETEGKILVVDDVAVNLKVFTFLLAKSKLQIDKADSGAMCLKMASEKKYDIIFLDHMMPEMDGIETLHKLKEDQASPNHDTPVIVLTANAIEGIRDQYISEGFDDYLSKPVNFNPLKDMIIKYL